MDVRLRSCARAEDMALLIESSARETCAWRKSRAVRICGVRRDVRFLVVVDLLVMVLVLLLEEGEDESWEGGKFERERTGGPDWRLGVGKSS